MLTTGLDVDQTFFKGKRSGDILILSFREKPLVHLMDLSAKKTLFSYLDHIDHCDQIKVLVVKQAVNKMRREEYIAFYESMIEPGIHQKKLERLYNAVGQLILKLAGLNKLVVHADSGDVILLFMNIALACDYRIVADNTVFQNPGIELGMLPKGGSTFFLSKMLGTAKASRLLFCGKDIDARQASHLGIVDQVVPLEELEDAAIKIARYYAQIPAGYGVGIKKLFTYDLNELADILEYENQLLRRLVWTCRLNLKIA